MKRRRVFVAALGLLSGLMGLALLRVSEPSHLPQPSRATHPTATSSRVPIVNPNQVYTYKQMVHDIQALVRRYPGLVQSRAIGHTKYGRTIYAVSLGYGKTTALINASHHAREWITTNLVMYMLDRYAMAYTQHTTIAGYSVRNVLQSATLWVIPMVNPDGVTLAQEGAGVFPLRDRVALIRMNHGSTNFADWKANAQGIDPNRQYNGGWYQMPRIEDRPWYENYPGTRPYEIAEVQAVVRLINQEHPQEEISYHASGDVIFWGFRLRPSDISAFYQQAQVYSRLTGYAIDHPTADETGGGLTDWWTHNLHRPGFTIEVGTYNGERPVPLQEFDAIWRANQAVGLQLAVDSVRRVRR